MLIGRLTGDPVSKALPSGTTVVNFWIATNREWKDREGVEHKEVDYHNIVCFGKLAEIVEKWCTKWMLIYVEGWLRTQSWEDRDSGKKMYRTEINMDVMQMLGSKNDSQRGASESDAKKAAPGDIDDLIASMPDTPTSATTIDDVPF